MARVYPASETSDMSFEPQPGEWQALRGELVALLDQVEGRYGEQEPAEEPKYEGLAQRVRDLRSQVSETPGSARRREALRSVKRAVDRFSDHGPEDEPDVLQTAIAEIRGGRQGAAQAPFLTRRRSEVAQLTELTGLVSSLSGRLERLEAELRRERSSAGGVREVASQVEQLTQVVELLAGAVGETGQVKRLEGQMASLAKLIEVNAKPDFSAINKRLDEVSATVGKLAELQVEQMEREVAREDAAEAESGSNFEAIESGVRNIYDRIDAIERNTGLSGTELERLTGEMAAFTAAMRENTAAPEVLLGRIDELSGRIGAFEDRNGDLAGLRKDISGLRKAVLDGIEPRFAKLESRIEAIGSRLEQSPGDMPSITAIEAQLASLVKRMDETGAQLDGLSRLYAEGERTAAPTTNPDLAAFADTMTERFNAAVREIKPAAVDQGALAEVEERMTALINTAGKDTAERLTRLEASLSSREKAPSRQQAAAPKPNPELEADAKDLDVMLAALSETRRPAKRDDPARDVMPANPADEAPLVDPGFKDTAPVRSALQAKTARKTPAENKAAEDQPFRPSFDPASVERPPRPVSSLAASEPNPFSDPPVAAASEGPVSAPLSSQSTFIAAARRAQRAKQSATPDAGANSVIGRALARVMPQGAPKEQAEPQVEAAPVVEPVLDTEEKPQRKRHWGRRAKAEAAAAQEDVVVEPAMEPAETEGTEDTDAAPESFLSRNRRPILLAAALVAVSALALNLAMQRNAATNQAAPPAAEATNDAPETEAPSTGAIEEVIEPALSGERIESAAMLTAPQLPEAIDAVETGSIGSRVTMSFETPEPAQTPAVAETAPEEDAVPTAEEPEDTAVALATPAALPEPDAPLDTAATEITESPVDFEMPPEEAGPLALRQAAADGDARAQFEIAAIYTEGRAIEQDLETAAVWYERAAAQGFVPAQYRLGNLYESGTGVEKDLEVARLWYQRAAEAGNRMAMHNLAAIYAGGDGGEQAFERAAEWFEQAAERGMTDSQFNLGMLYARGLGVEQDFEQSYKWFALAAHSGDADAAAARDDIATSLSAEAVARLKIEVAEWEAMPIALEPNFAPIGTWSETFDPGDPITNTEVILKVQTALGRLGFDIGTPDGVMGPKTRQAILAFERGTGMSGSGAVNPRLLAVLGSQPV